MEAQANKAIVTHDNPVLWSKKRKHFFTIRIKKYNRNLNPTPPWTSDGGLLAIRCCHALTGREMGR